jgi:cellulose biosynthesis protein BcsQ
MSTSLAVLSGKGGCGKTTTCVCLAAAAQASGMRVAVIDLDHGAGSSMALGVSRARKTVVDAILAGQVDAALVSSPVYAASDGAPLLLLPGTKEIATFPITAAALGELVAQCKQVADLVLIDTENNVLPMTAPAATADLLVFPTLLERASMEAVGDAMLLVDDVGGADRIGGILFNQVPSDLSRGWERTLDFYRWGFGGTADAGDDLQGLGIAYSASLPESRLLRRIFSELAVSGRLLDAARRVLDEVLCSRAESAMVAQYLADLRLMRGDPQTAADRAVR